MDKRILLGIGIIALAGLVYAGTDLVVTGDLLVNGNASVNGGAQFGSTVSAPDYLGETIETNAQAGSTCNAACSKWTTTTYQCVEALNGGTSVQCSDTVGAGARFSCLCKS